MGIQSTQLIQCHAGQMGHGLQKMTPPLEHLMSMGFDVTVLQEIGGHADMQKPEASEWAKQLVQVQVKISSWELIIGLAAMICRTLHRI